MVLAIFVGGIFLGFCVGFATMAAVVARGPRGQSEEVPEMAGYPTSAYSPSSRSMPSLRARPQASGVLLTPQP